MKHVLRGCMVAMAILMVLPGAARAGDFGIHPYIGAGAGVYDMKFNMPTYLFNQGNNAAGGFVRLGADFNDYLGAELRVGASDDGRRIYSTAPPGAPTGGTLYQFNLRARYLFSYLVKFQYPATQQFSVYAMVGGTTGNAKALGITDYAGKVATGLSYGGGFDYKVDDFMSVGLEYMSYWRDVHVNKSGFPPATMSIDSFAGTLKIEM